MARVLLVMVNLNPGLGVLDVQNVIGLYGAWLRLAPNLWLLRTAHSCQTVSAALQPLVEPNGTMLVSRLETAGSYGWLTQEAWNWLGGRG